MPASEEAAAQQQPACRYLYLEEQLQSPGIVFLVGVEMLALPERSCTACASSSALTRSATATHAHKLVKTNDANKMKKSKILPLGLKGSRECLHKARCHHRNHQDAPWSMEAPVNVKESGYGLRRIPDEAYS
eukprot:240330-Pelagomonas_calceolata.AAC.5